MTTARHLYVHVPFCAHRCGYCDFVTVTGREAVHAEYVDALMAELRRHDVAPETIYIGGGTPSLLDDELLRRLLEALPAAVDVTIECNPETVTPSKARVLREGGVTRISLGAQSLRPHLLETLERRARPETVIAAVELLRAAGHENLNLDLMFGVPGQSAADLRADIEAVLAIGPQHISWYELEAKPGTRFAVHHGAELKRQSEALEDHYETVVAALRGAGYRWYRRPTSAGRDTRVATTWATGLGTTIWAWGWAPSRRSACSAAATAPACGATWQPAPPAPSRPSSSSS